MCHIRLELYLGLCGVELLGEALGGLLQLRELLLLRVCHYLRMRLGFKLFSFSFFVPRFRVSLLSFLFFIIINFVFKGEDFRCWVQGLGSGSGTGLRV